MKPVYAKILKDQGNEIYVTRYIDRPFFSTEFHFHKECQLCYVVKSEGTRIIGDNVEKFSHDELVFLGSNIPHVWNNEKKYFAKSKSHKKQARSIALFFEPQKLLHNLSCFYNINKLEHILHIAERGMFFWGKTKEQIKEILFAMAKADGAKKMILLLELLELLCITSEYRLLASAGYNNTYHTKDNERIDKVFKFLLSNFASEIKLDEIAAIANMNKQAFCRFFKQRTQKTLSEFINEIRIANAVKLIYEKDASINTIAYECGYNSISNFNKFFKHITGKTPTEYRKSYNS